MSAGLVEMAEWRPEGTRNFIRPGDRVEWRPRPKRWPLEVVVRKILGDGTTAREIEVAVCRETTKGRPQNQVGQIRTARPEHIARLAQTHNGERRHA